MTFSQWHVITDDRFVNQVFLAAAVITPFALMTFALPALILPSPSTPSYVLPFRPFITSINTMCGGWRAGERIETDQRDCERSKRSDFKGNTQPLILQSVNLRARYCVTAVLTHLNGLHSWSLRWPTLDARRRVESEWKIAWSQNAKGEIIPEKTTDHKGKRDNANQRGSNFKLSALTFKKKGEGS